MVYGSLGDVHEVSRPFADRVLGDLFVGFYAMNSGVPPPAYLEQQLLHSAVVEADA